MEGDPLGKLLPLIQHIKMRRFDLCHPLQQVALDERMMSEARSHLIQYMRNKSTSGNSSCGFLQTQRDIPLTLMSIQANLLTAVIMELHLMS